MVDVARLAIEVDTSQASSAVKTLDNLSVAAGKTQKAANDSGAGLGDMGRKAGQASIQVQQLVGQIQGGVSPFVALSQQAADLGFVLGAPLLGAIVGMSAGLAGPFIMSLVNSSNE